jgi:hypothetical protein
MGGNQSTVHRGTPVRHGNNEWEIRMWVDSEEPFKFSSHDGEIQIANQIFFAMKEINRRMTATMGSDLDFDAKVKICIGIKGDYRGELGYRVANGAREFLLSRRQKREIKITLTEEDIDGVDVINHILFDAKRSISDLMGTIGIKGDVNYIYIRQLKHRAVCADDFCT